MNTVKYILNITLLIDMDVKEEFAEIITYI